MQQKTPSRVQLITDGTAILPPLLLRKLNIISLPIEARIGRRSYFYDQRTPGHIDLLREAAQTREPIEIIAPSADDFRAVFHRVLYRTNRMLVILSSRHLSPTVENAHLAALDFMGRCDIMILDSQTISVGLGLMVEYAGQLLQQGDLPLAEVVRRVRGMIPHTYVVLISHTLDYLYRSKKLSAMQAILGSMLNIHPFLEIEEGKILPLEKSRTPEKAVDKLLEFAGEFMQIEKLSILQNSDEPTREVLSLKSRLQSLFPALDFPIITYDPIIASHIGPEGLGLVIYEGLK